MTRAEEPVDEIYSTLIPVRITDINYGNHLGNEAMVGMLHEARVRFLGAGGWSEANCGEGVGLIQRDLRLRFRAEVRHGETLRFAVSVGELKRSSFRLETRVTSETREGLWVAEGSAGFAGFDYAGGRVARLPGAFVDFLAARRGEAD